LASSELTIRQHAEFGKPFTVAGEMRRLHGRAERQLRGVDLSGEAAEPFCDLRGVEGYPVPIDLNADAAEIEVAPDHTTITYSHIAFTVREISLRRAATARPELGAGVIALFQIEAVAAGDADVFVHTGGAADVAGAELWASGAGMGG
jgi:hypothetical protein